MQGTPSSDLRPTPSLAPRRAYRQDIVVAALVVTAIALMLVPVPSWVVDLLLAANVALGLVMLSSATLLADPLAFTAFPSLLILATLVRLAANVSTTRLILGTADGGAVVKAFGTVAMANSVTVGIVVFLLITVIQFVVIGRGAERIAEVTARFVLDAMPGKQQAIDADVRAGAIDSHEAGRRRARLATESQFFGSMDGAMKFIKGDAIATVIVVAINLIGGMVIALGQRGMSLGDAAATYSLLSIGEGLAAQVPALMAAAAAGILVARRGREAGSTRGALGVDLAAQLGLTPAALIVTGGVLALIAVVPGMPFAPFALLGAVCVLAVYGRRLWQPRAKALSRQAQLWHGIETSRGVAIDSNRANGNGNDHDANEPAYLLLGERLARALVADGDAHGTGPTFTSYLKALEDARGSVGRRLGFDLPPLIVVSPSATSPAGLQTVSLASHELCVVWHGVPRAWHAISEAMAETAGEAMVTPHDLATATTQGLLEAAPAFVTVESARAWCHRFADTPNRAAQVGDVVPRLVSHAQLANALRELVRDQVAIDDAATILRAMAATPPGDRDLAGLVERIRAALADAITHAISRGHAAYVWHMDPLAEDAIRDAITSRGDDQVLALAPELARDIVSATKHALAGDGTAPHTILVPNDIRRHVRALLYPELPLVAVIAHGEVRPGTTLVPRGHITV